MDALTEAIVRLLRRVEALEERLDRVDRALGIASPIPDQAAAEAPSKPEPQAPAPVEAQPTPGPAVPRQLETRFGLTWINRVGVITLVLAVAFFFKYAVDNRWIGETGRVLLGVAAGLGGLGLADFAWRRGHVVYAQGVTGAGIGILYLSLYASFGFYHLVGQGPAFFLMAMTTVGGGLLAVRYSSAAILALGLLGGYATPALLSTAEDRPWVFFSYVLILNVGALVVARWRKWPRIEILALLATAFLYGSWLDDRFQAGKEGVATFYALLYYALFAGLSAPRLFAVSQVLSAFAVLVIWTAKPAYLLLALMLLAAGLVLSGVRRHGPPAAAAFGSFWLLTIGWYAELREPRAIAATFLTLTAAFLLLLAWLPWRLRLGRPAPRLDLALLALNGLVYFGFSYSILEANHHAWLGLLALTLAGVHLAFGLGFRREQPDGGAGSQIPLLSTGMAIVFGTLAVPIQFAGYRITIAWAIESAALAWIGLRTHAQRLVHAALVLFLLTLARLYFRDAGMYPDPSSYPALSNARFLAFFVCAFSLWAAAYWIRRGWSALVTYGAGHAVMLSGLGLEVLGWAARSAAPESLASVRSASLSILIAVYALLLVGIGVFTRSAVNRILGLGLVALVVLKLYLYDVWQLQRIYRVTAFAILGVLLLLTSFLYSRYRKAIESWWKDGSAEP